MTISVCRRCGAWAYSERVRCGFCGVKREAG